MHISNIIMVGAEGGAITLFGFQLQDRWYFTRHVVDQTPELLGEDWVIHNTEAVGSFAEALELLTRYPWHKLYPLEVHPEFRTQVYEAVLERYTADDDAYCDRLENWKTVCEISSK